MIYDIFKLHHSVCGGFIKLVQHLDCQKQCFSGIICHVHSHILALLKRKAGCRKETGIQKLNFFSGFFGFLFSLLFRFGNRQISQLFKDPGNWENNNDCCHIECSMDHSNTKGARCLFKKRKVDKSIQCIKNSHKRYCLYDIVVQMDQGCPLGILAGTRTGDQCCHTGSYILSHDNGDRRSITYYTRCTQRLQDTNRCG